MAEDLGEGLLLNSLLLWRGFIHLTVVLGQRAEPLKTCLARSAIYKGCQEQGGKETEVPQPADKKQSGGECPCPSQSLYNRGSQTGVWDHLGGL